MQHDRDAADRIVLDTLQNVYRGATHPASAGRFLRNHAEYCRRVGHEATAVLADGVAHELEGHHAPTITVDGREVAPPDSFDFGAFTPENDPRDDAVRSVGTGDNNPDADDDGAGGARGEDDADPGAPEDGGDATSPSSGEQSS